MTETKLRKYQLSYTIKTKTIAQIAKITNQRAGMENASSILLLDYLVLSQNENTFIRRFGSQT